jgi:hypothetical protein
MSRDILDLIDAATGCQQCEGPLGSSPSDLFCSEDCQTTWSALRVGAPRWAEKYTAPRWTVAADFCGNTVPTGPSPHFRIFVDGSIVEYRRRQSRPNPFVHGLELDGMHTEAREWLRQQENEAR